SPTYEASPAFSWHAGSTTWTAQPHSRHPSHRSPEQRIRYASQRKGDYQCLDRIEPAEHQHLINDIEKDREKQHTQDRLQAFTQETKPLKRTADKCRQIRWPGFTRVFYAVPDCDQGSD